METSASQQKATNAKGWIVLAAAVLIVTPFIVLALRNNPTPAPMVWIPGGEFTMGDAKADEKHAEEAPGHAVVVKGFWMDVTEVTNAQFQAFVTRRSISPTPRRTSTRVSSRRHHQKCSKAARCFSRKSPA